MERATSAEERIKMTKKKLVIFGAGDIAELAKYYFDNDSDYEVVAFTVDQEFLDVETKDQLPVVAFESLETVFDWSMRTGGHFFINELRESARVLSRGYSLFLPNSLRCLCLV